MRNSHHTSLPFLWSCLILTAHLVVSLYQGAFQRGKVTTPRSHSRVVGGGGGFHLPFRQGKPLLSGQRVEKSQWPAGGNVGSHRVELEVEVPKGSRSPSPRTPAWALQLGGKMVSPPQAVQPEVLWEVEEGVVVEISLVTHHSLILLLSHLFIPSPIHPFLHLFNKYL